VVEPARSTSLAQLAAGVVGDPARWTAETRITPKSFAQILAARPASAQDRWFARLYLLKPLAILGLAVAAIVPSAAALAFVLGPRIVEGSLPVSAAVVVQSVVHLLAGLGLLVRPAARCALLVLLALTLLRLTGLWAAPFDLIPLVAQCRYVLGSDAACRSLHARNSGRPLMEYIFLLKFLHSLGAAVLFGTGIGIAFFMLMAHRTGHAGVIAVTARFVVIADLIFTATAVVVQPVTGFALARAIGLSPLDEPWMVLSILIYIFVGLCWLPVVFIQMRMRKLANDAAVNGKPLPAQYRLLFRIWFALGWPAFAGVIAIFALMIWQPRWW
jgi:uncharacterized membrane protein